VTVADSSSSSSSNSISSGGSNSFSNGNSNSFSGSNSFGSGNSFSSDNSNRFNSGSFAGNPRTPSRPVSRPSSFSPPRPEGGFQGSFIDVSARNQFNQAKIDVFEVPIKVEETFNPAFFEEGPGDYLKTSAVRSRDISKSDKGADAEDPDVFYIFYENSDEEEDRDLSGENFSEQEEAISVPAVFARIPSIVEDRPSNSQFRPPAEEEIRTIYVPIENAINIPAHFDINVGSSFGKPNRKISSGGGGGSGRKNNPNKARGVFVNTPSPAVPASPVATSYDNPISSYDAPITLDKSYTAPSPAGSSFYDSSASQSNYREIRRPAPVDVSISAGGGGDGGDVALSESSLFTPATEDSLPYGSRLGGRSSRQFKDRKVIKL
jgi:hypothetical protein